MCGVRAWIGTAGSSMGAGGRLPRHWCLPLGVVPVTARCKASSSSFVDGGQ